MTVGIKKTIFLLFVLCFCATIVGAQEHNSVVINEKAEKYPIQNELYIYKTEKKEGFNEIIKKENQNKFIKNKGGVPNLGFTDGKYWIRFSIKNNLNRKKVFLEFTYPFYNELDVYISDLAGNYKKYKVGDNYAFQKRPIYHKNFQFELDFYPLEEKIVYAYLPCDGEATSLPISIYTAKGLSQRDNSQQLAFGLYFGIMVFALFLALFLGATLKETSYWLYVLYIVSVWFFQSSLEGYAFQYFWPNNTWLANHIIPLAGACSIIFLMLFSANLLNAKEKAKKLNKALFFLSVIVGGLFVLSFLPQYASAIKYLNFAALLANILVFVTAIVVYKKGYKPARYFLIAFSLLLLGILLALLKNFGVLPRNFITEYAINIGSAIEIILLSFALSEKVKTLREEKEAAQASLLEELKEKNVLQERANMVLEQKVKERTAEINLQKDLIEEKNKEIIDSINYAQRIQRSLLASSELLNNNLQEYFIFFQPKDIVSGDFYWASKLSNGNFALATADSTGHGVPGAIMSMLNISCLNEAVTKNITAPDQLLFETRKRIIEHLKNDGSAEGGKDGMDCSLLSFDFNKKELSVSAANNPVWIIRNQEIIEIKPDKMPVGKHDKDTEAFTLQKIQLQKGDTVYTLTDGFPDQFGGPQGKKFKNQQLKSLLLDICNLDVAAQKTKLANTINSWMGDLEQVDDMLIIGIKI